MDDLKRRVTSCQSQWNVASTVQLDYYTSSVGQHYAILVTKGLWYKVRLFVENEHPNCPSVPLWETMTSGEKNRVEQDDLTDMEHLTWNGVKERIDNYRKFFGEPSFNAARKIMDQSGHFQPYFIREVPKDYSSNPNKYLKRGDIIATPFVKVALHTAIYLGNGQVGHMSGHGGGKADGVARIGTLIGNFVSKGTEKIWVVVSENEIYEIYVLQQCLPLRVRTREAIAQKAEELAANRFRDGDYNILLRNCQHFVFLCATGVEYAINV
ncbi:hypothetical protein CAEBREN_14356 [Caenorhabditis brenneri]|uniref:LRAT domain-containing protein n=1 Tax=Caenorhabditis brenneri TaxID=135651 RepID=G0MW41_CAEBE|nr:hypothetical protein CAEBREN_14356 [Caenorhabditis brenneri]